MQEDTIAISTASKRALGSVLNRVALMHRMSGVDETHQKEGSNTSTKNNPALSKSYEFLTELPRFLEEAARNGPTKGDYEPIDVEKLDLPSCMEGVNEDWISSLPEPFSKIFSGEKVDYLINPLVEGVRLNKPLIPHTVRIMSRQYSTLVTKMARAGMLNWSRIKDEGRLYRELATDITMTLFSVVKSETADRLISWPRWQNEYMPNPPYTDLPSPDLFSSIYSHEDPKLSATYFDLSNMFHYLRIPKAVAKYLPLQPVKYGNLPEDVQAMIVRELGVIPFKCDSIRPLQKTMTMGFKWSVYAAHTAADSIIRRAFSRGRLKLISRMQNEPKLLKLSQIERTTKLEKGCALVLHIIDDVDIVTSDWKKSQLVLFETACRMEFARFGFKTKDSKSSLPEKVIYDKILFLGWQWFLQENVLMPALSKLREVSVLSSEQRRRDFTPTLFRKYLGKVLWLALGLRPSLALLKTAFIVTMENTVLSDKLITGAQLEVSQLVNLLPIALVKPSRPTWNTIVAFDASLEAGGVKCTKAEEKDIAQLCSLAGKKRVLSPKEVVVLSEIIQKYDWMTAI